MALCSAGDHQWVPLTHFLPVFCKLFHTSLMYPPLLWMMLCTYRITPHCLSMKMPCHDVAVILSFKALCLAGFTLFIQDDISLFKKDLPTWLAATISWCLNASWTLHWGHWLALLVACILYNHIQLQRPQSQKYLSRFPSPTITTGFNRQLLKWITTCFRHYPSTGFLFRCKKLKWFEVMPHAPAASLYPKYCHTCTPKEKENATHLILQ